ncbi:MAG TPA: DUF4388 domain-containing protein [Polyangia bacterium]|nr:DUF4388 domain-containing protein [Polyangia bacterium]
MIQSPLVTLVDPAAKGLATLTYSFESEGFRVISSSDLGMSSELVRSTGARVAVVSLRPPEAPGLRLIAEIMDSGVQTGADGTARGPAVVVLGPPGSRSAALGAGASDYIDTPAFVRDAVIIARLRLMVRPPGAHRDGAGEIAGTLEAVHGLFALMRAMAAVQRSGVLQLSRDNRKAEIKFAEGAVTSAQVRGLQAFPALHQLLLWHDAELTLKLRDVPKRQQFSASGTEILEESERFLRDVHHAVRQLGAFDAVFARDTRHGGPAPAVPEAVAPVARLFDGARTLGDVIEESPFRIFDTLRAIKRLIDGGFVIARAPGFATPATGRAAAPPAAAPRARTRTAPQAAAQPTARTPASHDPDAVTRDRRGAAPGDRRKIVRRTPTGFAKPAAKTAPAPIPLVTRKSPSGAFAAGEIRAPRAVQPPPARSAPAARQPSVEIRRDTPTLSLDVRVPTGAFPMTDSSTAPAPAAASAPVPAPGPAAPNPAPISARELAAPIRPKKSRGPATTAPATAFSALEADFFAREADLYKDQGPDTFEDLEHAGENPRPRTATPRGSKKR